ncbi:MAG TPA: nuclear transport factor 2 family protein [Acidimicrobiales bacterium]|nr:nuclear transport factor 2 family protein [Acidimicrobiales bacterium]
MAHPNAEVLRLADEAMLRGDIEEFFSYYTDDVIVHASGKSRLAGDYEGRDQLQELFGQFMEAMGEYSFENHAYLADDQHGVILQRGRAMEDGQTHEFNEVFVFHFRDGKISEMWYVPVDQAAVDALIG